MRLTKLYRFTMREAPQALGPAAPLNQTVCSLWDTSYSLSEQFSNKCKTQNGLFGIISSKLGLLFPGILWNWIQTGIYFSDPWWDLHQWREEGAAAEVEGYFNSIYTYCIYYCVSCYCMKWKATESLLSNILCIKWLHKDKAFRDIKSYKCSFKVGEKNNGNSETALRNFKKCLRFRCLCGFRPNGELIILSIPSETV